MDEMTRWRMLADLVLVTHWLLVLFVVGMPLLAAIGRRRGWRWSAAPLCRGAHLAVLLVVVLLAWLGRPCPLTSLEHGLRLRAGEAGYAGDFVAEWLHRMLYLEAPWWVFALVYSAFLAWVVGSWWWRPAHGRGRRHQGAKPGRRGD